MFQRNSKKFSNTIYHCSKNTVEKMTKILHACPARRNVPLGGMFRWKECPAFSISCGDLVIGWFSSFDGTIGRILNGVYEIQVC